MGFVDDLINAFRATGDASIERARLGKGDAARTLWVDANSEVPGAGLVYVHQDAGDAATLASRPTEYSTALNPSGIAVYGAPVLTAESKGTNQRIVLGFDPDRITDFMASSGRRNAGVGEHPHGIFDEIPIWLDSRQILNLSIQPKNDFGLTVQMVGGPNRTIYLDNSGLPVVIAGSIDIDLSASVAPTPGMARWVAISLNLATGAPVTTDGDEFAPIAGPFPVIPDILSGNLPSPSSGLGLGYVYLANAQTAIEHQHIRSIERTGGGGGGVDPLGVYAGGNLVKNFPPLAGNTASVDWWTNGAAAVTTSVTATGEGVAKKHDQMLKTQVAFTPSADYLSQTYTQADEDLIVPGAVVSLGVWVYAKTSGVVRVALRDAVTNEIGFAVTTLSDAWEYIRVEGAIIGANDLELRFAGDTASQVFYITMPMLNVGSQALVWRPRGVRFVESMALAIPNNNPPDNSWATVNLTAATHPLATSINAAIRLGSTVQCDFEARRTGVPSFYISSPKLARSYADVDGLTSNAMILMDGAQNIDVRATASIGTAYEMWTRGFWRWV